MNSIYTKYISNSKDSPCVMEVAFAKDFNDTLYLH